MTFIQLQPSPIPDLFGDRLKLFQVQQMLDQQSIVKKNFLRDQQSQASFGTALTALQNNDQNALAKSISTMTPEHVKGLFDIQHSIQQSKYQNSLEEAQKQNINQSRTQELLKQAYAALPNAGLGSAEDRFFNSGASPNAQRALQRINTGTDNTVRSNYASMVQNLQNAGVDISKLPLPENVTKEEALGLEAYIRNAQSFANPLSQIPGSIQIYAAQLGLDPRNPESYKDPRVQKLLSQQTASERNLTNANAYQSRASGQAALINARANATRVQQDTEANNNSIPELKDNSILPLSMAKNNNILPPFLSITNGNESRAVTGRQIKQDIDLANDTNSFVSLGMKTIALSSQLNLLDRAKIPFTNTTFSTLENIFQSNIKSLLNSARDMNKSGALDAGVLKVFSDESGSNKLWGRTDILVNMLLNSQSKTNSKLNGTIYSPNKDQIIFESINDIEQALGHPLTGQERLEMFKSMNRGFKK